MDEVEARRRLSFHSSRNGEIDHPLWDKGFVRLLRPFRGENLLESAFHEIVQLTYVLSDSLQKEQLEKEMMADFWTIIYCGQSWGSNSSFFTDQERKQIADFTEQLSYPVFCLLDGTDKETAFEMYLHEYPEKAEEWIS